MDGRTVRSQKTKALLLDAGNSLLSEHGSVEALTIAQLCEHSGSSRSSFYNSFGDQAGYLDQLHEMLTTSALEALAHSDASGLPSTPSIADVLELAVEHSETYLRFAPAIQALMRRETRHTTRQSALEVEVLTAINTWVATADPPTTHKAGLDLVGLVIFAAASRGTHGRVPFLEKGGEAHQANVESITRILNAYLSHPEFENTSAIQELAETPVRPADSPENRILDAVERLLIYKDSSDVTVLEIAVEADVSQSYIYDRFDSKTSILTAVVDRVLKEAVASAEPLMPTGASEPADFFVFVRRAYSLLMGITADRLHLLEAFENPSRLSTGVATLLAETEAETIRRGVSMLPPWVAQSESLADISLAIRMSKVAIQCTSTNSELLRRDSPLDSRHLLDGLALMTVAALDA